MDNLTELQRQEVEKVMEVFKADIGKVQYCRNTFEDYLLELAPDLFRRLGWSDLDDIAEHYGLLQNIQEIGDQK